MLQWKTVAKKHPMFLVQCLGSQHFRPNLLNQKPKRMAIFSVITHFNYTCLSSWALLIIVAILFDKCFQKEKFTAQGRVKKFLYQDNILPSHTGANFQLLRRASVETGFPFGQKKPIILFVTIFSNFWCSVVTSIMFINNLSNFETNSDNL